MFDRVLNSSKFQAAAAGILVLVILALVNHQQIDPNVLSGLVTALVAAFIGATAYEDGQKAKASVAPTTTVETPASNVTVTTTDTPQPPAPPASPKITTQGML